MNGSTLSTEQKRAILHGLGPMMVLAGPGSGKTLVLTWRVLCLLTHHRVEDEKIVVLTYTKAAAQEMRSRFFRLLGTDQCRVRFGTIHSLCLELLRDAGTKEECRDNLITEKDSLEILQEYLIQFEGFSQQEARDKGNEILQRYSYLRNVMQEVDQNALFQRCIMHYEKQKAFHSQWDYDDLLTRIYEKLTNDPDFQAEIWNRYQYFLVDEFQDVSPLQYEILKVMSRAEQNLFVVGDDDQAIYGFRGSESAIMQQFPKDYPESQRVLLKTNYRSREKIVRFAECFIAHNQLRYSKDIHSGRESGSGKKYLLSFHSDKKIRLHCCLSQSGEGRKIAAILNNWQERTVHDEKKSSIKEEGEKKKLKQKSTETLAVLLRTSFEAGDYVSFLLDYGIYYDLFGQKMGPYHHWTGDDLWLVYRASCQDSEAQKKLFHLLYPRETDAIFYWESSETILREQQEGILEKLLPRIRDHELYLKIAELDYELKKLSGLPPVDFLDRFLDRSEYSNYLRERAIKRRVPYFVLKKRIAFWREDLKQFDTWEQWNRHRLHQMDHPDETVPYVQLETMHSSKGLEYDRVLIPGIVKGQVPHHRNEDLEEERRLLYVAITRAKEQVILFSYRKFRKSIESPFWRELKQANRNSRKNQ